MASYYSFPLEKSGLYFGLGLFVQIHCPSANRFVQLGHLSEVSSVIPFSVPVLEDKTWLPVNHTLAIDQLKTSDHYNFIEKGSYIGKIGLSGLTLKFMDYEEGIQNKESYDEPHVHFEEFWRDQATGVKGWQRDPYGIYLSAQNYPTPTHKGKPLNCSLFYLDSFGLPLAF